MLRLNVMTDIAVRILKHLADGEPHYQSASMIAKQLTLSQPMVKKTLLHLVSHDFIQTKPGCQGGYGLIDKTRERSLYELLQATESRTSLMPCQQTTCSQNQTCETKSTWDKLNLSIISLLKGYPLQSFLQSHSEGVPS
jgi:Rrf2 family protein